MATGIVKFYNIPKGFGFIGQPDGSDVYVNRADLFGNGFRYLVAEERVEFDILAIRDGKLRARDVRPIAGRLRGIVKTFDHGKGFGFIEPDDGSDNVFVHFSAVLGDGTKTAVVGETVEFEKIVGERGPQAVKVKRCDPRLPLFKFADMGPMAAWLEDLATLAEPENWDFRLTHEHHDLEEEKRRPILKSYLIYTFARLDEENKIGFGSEGKRHYSCFNTGLVTEMQEEIYALFEEPARPQYAEAPWQLLGFRTKSDRQLLSKFDKLPVLANYFEDPSELLYDRRKELHMDIPHIIRDNIHRFPMTCRNNEYLARQLLESARSVTQQRVYRNYKTAIPQFHRGEIQLLLPICLERPNQADLALVVSRVGDQYRGDTVLTLDMAYNNARLITRPDTEWLTP